MTVDVEVELEIESATKALDERHGAGCTNTGRAPGLVGQMGRDRSLKDAQKLISREWAVIR